MNGKLVGIAVILPALLVGGGIWYAQEYYFYDSIDPASDAASISIETATGPKPLLTQDFQGIDADSSPLRWRICARLETALPADATPYDGATPLYGPRWFDCFNADQIGADLESGAATAWLAQSEIRPDVDRILAVYPDGRVYGWHQYDDKTPERGVMD
ncbi:histidine kinase [Paracoccus caeni]|uniref:Histidine kinase n=1 Tax=Paracoccus caeni TaxID=657651 RepID=A0A934VXD6_9RHOB|nr:DUF6446 family protein [Paracoccus caeni]MBK4214877.1 histidine kinase [Paracoccus caeni]